MNNFFMDSFLPSLGIIVVLLGIPFGLKFIKDGLSKDDNNEERESNY